MALARRGTLNLLPAVLETSAFRGAPSLSRPQRRALQRLLHTGVPQPRGTSFFRRQNGALRWCGNNAPKRRTGFEKFFEKAEAKPNKGPEADAQKAAETPKSEAPREVPKKGAESEASKAEGAKTSESGSGPKGEEGKSSSGSSKGSGGLPFQANGDAQRQLAGVALGVAAYLMYSQVQDPPREITVQELMREYLVKGYVDKIQIVNQSVGRVYLRNETPNVPVTAEGRKVLSIQLGNAESFEAKLEQLQAQLGVQGLDFIPIQYVQEADYMEELYRLAPTLLILVPMILAARAMSSRMGGGMGGGPGGPRNMFSIGKAFPAGKKDLKSKTKFADVAGHTQAKQEVMEFVDFLKDPSKFEALGAKIPKGGLLVGPPGTGKTLLAKAVAGEADCPFYSMSGSDFIEMFVGVGPSRVRDLFQQARASAPSIIFIDEIDAVGRKRGKGGAGGGNDERENTLNQMLVEMDGFATGTGVVVLAGTNRADILDPALTRPGRFDRQISIDKPDLEDRALVFKVHLKPVKLHDELDVDSVAQRMAALTPGFAGSDIANICNEAAIFAARRSSSTVEMKDFENATERIIGGLPKTNNLMGEKQRRTVAIHESGHALAGWFLENADPLLKVSIVPRANGALGFAQYLPEEMSLYSKEAILDKMCVTLGGRAAEELFTNQISTGASDDLDKVTKMAYSMVSVYGMNDSVGLVSFGQNNSSEQFYKPYSEKTATMIDSEARQLINQQYERVKVLLEEKKDLIMALSDKLFEKETLVYKDLKAVLGERPFDIKKEYHKFVTAGGSSPFEMQKEADAPEGESVLKAEGESGGESVKPSETTTEEAKAPDAEGVRTESAGEDKPPTANQTQHDQSEGSESKPPQDQKKSV